MAFKKFIGSIIFMLILTSMLTQGAEELKINPQHPQRYEVVPGDTLWDIAKRFLVDPWRWQDLWRANPHIESPDLIYPGDVITLNLVNGQVVTEITRGGAVVKLSPTIRNTALVEPVPTIPLGVIQPFLTRVRVTTEAELASAAYVIGQADHRLAAATGDLIYARGLLPGNENRYDICRAGRPYYSHSQTGNPILLGIEAVPVGVAELTRPGDPATLRVMKSYSEILSGDRLLAEELQIFNRNFMPHAPAFAIEGHIIDVVGGLSRFGRLQTVVLDKGSDDGLDVGHVLIIYQAGESIKDPMTQEIITLPEEQAGLLMVFRVFTQLSYALILEAQREMKLFDVVRTPQ